MPPDGGVEAQLGIAQDQGGLFNLDGAAEGAAGVGHGIATGGQVVRCHQMLNQGGGPGLEVQRAAKRIGPLSSRICPGAASAAA